MPLNPSEFPDQPGNIDVAQQPIVPNPDGTVSTVRSFSTNIDGKEILLPTVSRDGANLTKDEAIARYKKTGEMLGSFSSVESANEYAQKLHEREAQRVALDPARFPDQGQPNPTPPQLSTTDTLPQPSPSELPEPPPSSEPTIIDLAQRGMRRALNLPITGPITPQDVFENITPSHPIVGREFMPREEREAKGVGPTVLKAGYNLLADTVNFFNSPEGAAVTVATGGVGALEPAIARFVTLGFGADSARNAIDAAMQGRWADALESLGMAGLLGKAAHTEAKAAFPLARPEPRVLGPETAATAPIAPETFPDQAPSRPPEVEPQFRSEPILTRENITPPEPPTPPEAPPIEAAAAPEPPPAKYVPPSLGSTGKERGFPPPSPEGYPPDSTPDIQIHYTLGAEKPYTVLDRATGKALGQFAKQSEAEAMVPADQLNRWEFQSIGSNPEGKTIYVDPSNDMRFVEGDYELTENQAGLRGRRIYQPDVAAADLPDQFKTQTERGIVRPKVTNEDWKKRPMEAGLIQATHSLTAAEDRWAKLRETGATDEQIKQALARELGSQGGYSSPDIKWYLDYKGGANPEVKIEDSTQPFGKRDTQKLSGKKLIAKTRRVLNIPQPGQAAAPPPETFPDQKVTASAGLAREGSAYQADNLTDLLSGAREEQSGRFATLNALQGELGKATKPKKIAQLKDEIENLKSTYEATYNEIEMAGGDPAAIRKEIEASQTPEAPKPVEPAPAVTKAAVKQAPKADTSPQKMRVQKEYLLDALDKARKDAPETVTSPEHDAEQKLILETDPWRVAPYGEDKGPYVQKQREAVQPLIEKYGLTNYRIQQPAEEGWLNLAGERRYGIASEKPSEAVDRPATHDELMKELHNRIDEARVAALPKITIEVPGDGTFEIINSKEAIATFRDEARKHFPTVAARAQEPRITGRTTPEAIPKPGAPKTREDYIKIAAPAASTDETRYVLHQAVASTGNELIATDGRRLAAIDFKGPTAGKQKVAARAEIGKPLPKKPKMVEVEKPAIFGTKTLKRDAAKEESTYPNWKQVVPDTSKLGTHKKYATIDTGSMMKLVTQAEQMTSERSKAMTIWIDDKGKLGVTSNDPDVGMFAGGDADPNTAKQLAAFNPEFFKDGLRMARQLGHEKVDFFLGKKDPEISPVVLQAKGMKYVLMPMRISDSGGAYSKLADVSKFGGEHPLFQPPAGEKMAKVREAAEQKAAKIEQANKELQREAQPGESDQLQESVIDVWNRQYAEGLERNRGATNTSILTEIANTGRMAGKSLKQIYSDFAAADIASHNAEYAIKNAFRDEPQATETRRTFPAYTTDELKSQLSDPNLSEAQKEKMRAEIAARESGASKPRVIPQLRGGGGGVGDPVDAATERRLTAAIKSGKPSKVRDIFEENRRKMERQYSEALRAAGNADAIEMRSSKVHPEMRVIISREPSQEGKWRATRLGPLGDQGEQPYGHNIYDSRADAIADYTGKRVKGYPPWAYDFKVTRRLGEAPFEGLGIAEPNVAAPVAPTAAPSIPKGQTMMSMGAGLPVTMERTAPGQVAARDIIDALSQVMQTAGSAGPIRSGRFNQRTARGIFKPFSEVVRLNHIDNVPTAVHETGHALQKAIYGTVKAKGLAGLPPAVKRELIGLGKALYGSRKPVAGYTGEGFSEFMRYYLTTDDGARQTAPKMLDFFEKQVLPANPELARQLGAAKKLIDVYRTQGAFARANSQIVGEPGWTRRVLGAVRDVLNFQTVAESAEPLRQLSKEAAARLGQPLAPARDPYRLFKMKRGTSGAIMERMVENNMVDVWGNPIGPSLKEALTEVRGGKEAYNKFMLYLFSRRAEERWSKGINPGITREDARYVRQSLESPAFDRAASKYYQWWDGVLHYMVQADPTTASLVTRIKQGSSDYAPLARVIDPIAARAEAAKSQSNPLYRMKGSGLPVKDILEQTVKSATRLIERANRGLITNAIFGVSRIEGMGKIIEEVPLAKVRQQFNFEKIRQELENMGIDTTDVPEDTILSYYTPAEQPKGADPIIAHKDAMGKTRWYYVEPKLYNTLAKIEPPSVKSIAHMGPVLDLIGAAPKRLFTLGTTGLRPTFSLLTNPLRDPQGWLLQTKAGINPAKMAAAYFQAMGDQLRALFTGKEGPFMQAALNLGPQMSQALGRDINYTRHVVKGMFHGKLMRVVLNPIDAARQALNIPESFPRLAEFRRVADEIGWKPDQPMTPDQAVQLAISFKEATVDFSAAGDASRWINEFIPFFNPNIQGVRTAARAFRDHPLRTTLFGLAAITGPSLALWWANKDKEWYRNLPWREKYYYTNIEDGHSVWQIPRPFEWSNLFQVLPEAALDSWYQRDPRAVTEALGHIWQTQNPMDYPVLLRVAKEQWQNNIDFWDRPIVPRSDIDLPPRLADRALHQQGRSVARQSVP